MTGMGNTDKLSTSIQDDLTPLRQKARNEFVGLLHDAHPDPRDSTRQQVAAMFDQWWPGTVPGPLETQA